MAYVNKQNLSDFWANAKRYIAARDADQCDWTSVPVNAPVYQFEAEPRTPVNPVIEFGFTETLPAEGEKGPENPSTITGVDSVTVTRTGKNLLPTNWIHDTMEPRGITVTRNSDGSLHLEGTVTSSTEAYLTFFNNAENGVVPVLMKSGTTLTVSVECSDNNIFGAIYDSNSLTAWGSPVEVFPGNPKTHTMQSDVKSAMFRIVARRGSVLNCDVRVQIEYGSEATAWEPPAPVSATVSLGETRYGGTLDVATGKMTVTHVGYDIGESTTSYSTSNTVFFFDAPKTSLSTLPVCESFVYHAQISNFADLPDGQFMPHIAATPATQTRWIFKATNYSTIEEFKSAFSGKKLVYQLDTPFTIDLDPQQLFSALSNSKVNTVFTDTGTISQLTYAKPAPRQEDVFRYANWHRTELAGAVACYPVPESELHPMVNFSFTETPPAEGEKGPENPSTIAGVSSLLVGRCGKNLVRHISPGTFSNNGVSFITAKDGSITVSGTAGTGNSNYDLSSLGINTYFDRAIPVIAGHTYTVSGCPSGGSSSTYCMFGGIFNKNGNAIAYNVLNDTGNGKTYTAISDGYIFLRITITAGYTASNLVFWPQVEENISETNYEIPNRNVDTIDLNGTYYGGSIDLSTGLMTVTHASMTLNGNTIFSLDGFTEGTSFYTLKIFPTSKEIYRDSYGLAGYASDKFTIIKSPTAIASGNLIKLMDNSVGVLVTFDKTAIGVGDGESIADVGAAAKSWLASNNVRFFYKLATPTTVQLTPQQIKALPALDKYSYRVNTLYTDADSIQVGYMKSPIKTEEEFNNAILALGGNL